MPAGKSTTIGSIAGWAALVIAASAVAGGCSKPQRRVLAVWRGRYLGQMRADEKIRLLEPNLVSATWSAEPAVIELRLNQRRQSSFNLFNRYEKVAAVRHLSAEQAAQLGRDAAKSAHLGLFVGISWLLPPVGASMTGGSAAMENRRAQRRHRTEQEVIEQLKRGTPQVAVPIDYRWRTLETLYKREIVGEETELVGPRRSEQDVPAAGLPVRLEAPELPSRRLTGRTDESGAASIRLAQRPAEAVTLRPCTWRILARWAGQWRRLGSIAMDQERIDRILQAVRAARRAAVGKPASAPRARVLLKVSNGGLTAGQENYLALTVLNTGKGEFYRLQAVTESAVSALNGLVFDFGRLDPGEGLTLTRKVAIRPDEQPGQVGITFRWSELNGYAPNPLQAAVPLRAAR